MDLQTKKQKWKFFLLIFAALIAIFSLLVTNKLIKKLENEERKKVQLWAEGTRHLANLNKTPEEDVSFLFEIVQNNTTVPVILVNSQGEIVSYRNLDEEKSADNFYLQQQLEKMKSDKMPIEIELFEGEKNFIYYRDSIILTQLSYYPYVQLFLISLFILLAYYSFNNSRKAEQNQVWLGMSKETAHQLGTPTSSLMAWIELLKEKELDQSILNELEKDVTRLEKITDRFSKIGSSPALVSINIGELISNVVDYMKKRVSEKIEFHLDYNFETQILVPVNNTLFEWVIENLIKNSINAMNGMGRIDIKITDNTQFVFVDIKDTGKGIPKNMQKSIFQPGFTTRERGWGLGLSLAKRIIEVYHKGKIFVNYSEPNVGTTMRIVLKK